MARRIASSLGSAALMAVSIVAVAETGAPRDLSSAAKGEDVETVAVASVAVPPSSSADLEIKPRINKRLSEDVRSKIGTAFELAQDRLRSQSGCRALFEDLGRDGRQALSTTLYYAADVTREKRLCPNALAFSLVGGAPTWVCRRFARLSDSRAAVVLLHEALHHAGMGERPGDPSGLTPREIDELVTGSCLLGPGGRIDTTRVAEQAVGKAR